MHDGFYVFCKTYKSVFFNRKKLPLDQNRHGHILKIEGKRTPPAVFNISPFGNPMGPFKGPWKKGPQKVRAHVGVVDKHTVFRA